MFGAALVACDHPKPAPQHAEEGAGAATPGADLTLRIVDVGSGRFDPRFTELPVVLQRAELLPQVTLQLETELPVGSVLFELDGRQRLDDQPPFRVSESLDGQALDWALTPGSHQLSITAYSSRDGQGWAVGRTQRTFRLEERGMSRAAVAAEHETLNFWVTREGRTLTRAPNGDFVDLRGEVVVPHERVALRVEGDDLGRLETLGEADPKLEFAFQVLLPADYDAAVHYPLVVFLHHGWEVFRGTDNDGRVVRECPPFKGARSLIRGPGAKSFPAVFLVPQMSRKETLDGVEQEWGAFTHLDNDRGDVHSAPQASVNGARVYKALNDLLTGALPIHGRTLGADPQRVYLTGHSMGGLGTWDFAQRWPELWAAALPMAGYPDHSTAGRVAELPIWAFHHRADCYNPFVGTESMVDLVKRAGGDVRFTELAFDVGGKCEQAHFRTPEVAWDAPELTTWLFSQVRGKQ